MGIVFLFCSVTAGLAWLVMAWRMS